MGSVGKLWDRFYLEILLPAGIKKTDVQCIEMRRAFYAGAFAILDWMKTEVGDDSVTEDQGVVMLESARQEMDAFKKAIMEGASMIPSTQAKDLIAGLATEKETVEDAIAEAKSKLTDLVYDLAQKGIILKGERKFERDESTFRFEMLGAASKKVYLEHYTFNHAVLRNVGKV